MRIGVQSPASRRRAQSSSPASLGSITSRISASYAFSVASHSPSDAVQGHVDGVPLGLQAAPQRPREVLVVLDDQDPHAASVARSR